MDVDEVVKVVIGSAYEVSNTIGAGFLEKVYQRALAHELTLRGLKVQGHVCYPVDYKGQCVGDYVADLLIEHQLIVELKCVDAFSNVHMAQCINYLKASGLRLALLLNFNHAKVAWKRVVYGPLS